MGSADRRATDTVRQNGFWPSGPHREGEDRAVEVVQLDVDPSGNVDGELKPLTRPGGDVEDVGGTECTWMLPGASLFTSSTIIDRPRPALLHWWASTPAEMLTVTTVVALGEPVAGVTEGNCRRVGFSGSAGAAGGVDEEPHPATASPATATATGGGRKVASSLSSPQSSIAPPPRLGPRGGEASGMPGRSRTPQEPDHERPSVVQEMTGSSPPVGAFWPIVAEGTGNFGLSAPLLCSSPGFALPSAKVWVVGSAGRRHRARADESANSWNCPLRDARAGYCAPGHGADHPLTGVPSSVRSGGSILRFWMSSVHPATGSACTVRSGVCSGYGPRPGGCRFARPVGNANVTTLNLPGPAPSSWASTWADSQGTAE